MLIKKCFACKRYTLREVCPNCGKPTENPHPARFSLEKEKILSEYRKKAKA